MVTPAQAVEVHPALVAAIEVAKRLPERLGPDDFEVVSWDGVSPINGLSALRLRMAMTDGDGRPCSDARVALVRERTSGIVFCVQHVHPDRGHALRSDADLEQATTYLRQHVLPRMGEADPSGPVLALLRNAGQTAGLSPQAMAAMLGRMGG